MDLKYSLNETYLIISEKAIKKMDGYKQINNNIPEGGGLLLGRTDISGNTYIVDITEPLSKDIRKQYFFKRIDKRHIELLKIANQRCLYFKGNWHTHSQAYPVPSWLDKKSWKTAMRKSKPGESVYIFFIIVGINRLRVWAGNMETEEINEMRLQF